MGAMHQSLLMSKELAPADPLMPALVSLGAYAPSITGPVVPVPEWYADGDVLVLLVTSANQSIATPSGWTQVANSPQSTGTAGAAGGVRLAVFYKVVSGVQSNLTLADSGDYTIGQMATFRYANPTTPIDVTAGSVKSSATGTTFTLPAVTTTAVNDLVLLCVGQDRDLDSTANLSAWTNANLSDILEHIDRTISNNTGGGLGLATGGKATAGSTGTTTVTSAAATTAAFLTVALNGRTDYLSQLRMVGANGIVVDTTYDSVPAEASVTINTDGTITTAGGVGDGTSVNANWLNYASSGAGSSYWVRATTLSNIGAGGTSGTVGSWLQLNSARTWSAFANGADTAELWDLKFEFSTDSAGSTIVGVSSVSLAADCNSGVEP